MIEYFFQKKNLSDNWIGTVPDYLIQICLGMPYKSLKCYSLNCWTYGILGKILENGPNYSGSKIPKQK